MPSKCVRTSKIRADRWLHRRRSKWCWRGCADGEQGDKRGLVAVPDDEQRRRGLPVGKNNLGPSHNAAESAHHSLSTLYLYLFTEW